jgi:uncharacterized protein YoxC
MEYAPLDYQDENPLTILGGLPSTNSFDNITTNDLLNNIEPVTSVQNTFNESIIIRDTLQNVLQGVEVLPIDDKDFKDPEIDTIIDTLKGFSKTFDTLQKELDDLKQKYNEESNKTIKNIEQINSSIAYMKTMNELYDKDKSIKDIVDKMNEYNQIIKENDILRSVKNDYIQKRKQLNKHLYLIQCINGFNISATCPICMTNTIDSYCNPCGHTYCGECLQKNSNIVNNVNNNKCLICREYIMDIRKLYFI